MKRIAAIAIVAATTVTPVQAAGFQPWAERAVGDRVDAVQSDVVARPYYRPQAPVLRDTRQAPQADVVIQPWYSRDRV